MSSSKLPPRATAPAASVDTFLILAAGLHLLVVVALLAYAAFAPKPPPVVAVFELVSVDRPKLRPLAPKTPEPVVETPEESRPPEAPALTPQKTPVPAKPEPKTTKPAPSDPSLPIKDVARENTSHNVTVADAPSNPQLAFWAGRIKQRVQSLWNPPTGIDVEGPAKTIISFQVERSGKISHVEIAQSSGNPLLDNLAKNTILRLDKVPPIPGNFPGDLLKVSYEFIYNGD